MIHILFVDDEVRILDGIRRSLYGMRGEWQVRYVNSGDEALKALEEGPVDVLVSDMRMPGMDGSELLAEVKRVHPEVIRFVLSGHAEMDSIVRVTRSAHRYLSKPCEIATLKSAITSAIDLRALFTSPELETLVGSVDALPSPPKRYQELLACLRDPGAGIGDIVRILGQDVAMTAKIVTLANSGFFGCREPVQSVERAVSFVGMEAIALLVLGQELFDPSTMISSPGFDLEHLGQHSFQTAAWARTISLHQGFSVSAADSAFLAGLLHDIGKLVFATRKPPALTSEREQWLSDTKQQMQSHHAAVGAYLLGLWGFPESIVEAVAWHHTPDKCAVAPLGLCGLVHIGDQLANGRDIDPGHLESLGLGGRLDDWKRLRS
jgi:putative nucleotidyltransferase with HDIG domain